MPEGKAANALEQLLVEKYGIPPEEAYDYAAEIIADKQGSLTGDQGKYLQQEALAGVANTEEARIQEMLDYVAAIQKGGPSGPYAGREQGIVDKFNQGSMQRTQQEASRVYNERQNARVGAIADNLATTGSKLQNIASMVDEQGNYIQPAPPQNVAVNPPGVQRSPNYYNKEAAPQVQLQPNPYELRLQRALDLRKQVLGY